MSGNEIQQALVIILIVSAETKWGLGLNAADFPPENAVPFSRVGLSLLTLLYLH